MRTPAARFVALGDSITVGMGDPMADGSWRGWAALLAEGLGPPGAVEFHNLAFLGARTLDVAGRQLPRALQLRPTVATVIVGVNDTLRATFDLTAIGQAVTGTVGALRDSGAVVLTARLPDPGRMFGLPGALARPLARRISAVNGIIDFAARRYRTVHFDVANHPETYLRCMWSVDRLHPSERGHRMLAANFAGLLAARGFPVHRWPDRRPANPPPGRRAEITWLATRGTRWVRDRCTDLVPSLLRMAAAESWYKLRGQAQRFDELLDGELANALAQLEAGPLGSRVTPT